MAGIDAALVEATRVELVARKAGEKSAREEAAALARLKRCAEEVAAAAEESYGYAVTAEDVLDDPVLRKEADALAAAEVEAARVEYNAQDAATTLRREEAAALARLKRCAEEVAAAAEVSYGRAMTAEDVLDDPVLRKEADALAAAEVEAARVEAKAQRAASSRAASLRRAKAALAAFVAGRAANGLSAPLDDAAVAVLVAKLLKVPCCDGMTLLEALETPGMCVYIFFTGRAPEDECCSTPCTSRKAIQLRKFEGGEWEDVFDDDGEPVLVDQLARVQFKEQIGYGPDGHGITFASATRILEGDFGCEPISYHDDELSAKKLEAGLQGALMHVPMSQGRLWSHPLNPPECHLLYEAYPGQPVPLGRKRLLRKSETGYCVGVTWFRGDKIKLNC